MIVLKTERLIIRDHEAGDLQAMHGLLSDDTTMYYMQDIRTGTLEESEANLQAAMDEALSPDRQKYFFKIMDRRDRRYIGEIGFTVELDTPFGKIVHLGYFILPEFWGRGIVAEAAGEVFRFAFEDAGAIKIETGCIKENSRSERVMEKLGMIKEAEYRMHVWHDGRLKDRVEYRLTRDEWERMKETSE